MNKLFFALIIFLSTTSLWAACPKGSESGATIIFLDLNNNPKEIESTKRAACKRGESVLVLPEKGKNFDPNDLNLMLSSLERNEVSVNSFVISGHDGGGQFGGANGFFSKSMLAELMEKYPKSRESVSSVLLLGCYTGVRQEIFDWKQILPNANLIAGYEGQAPLGDKPAGHSYIEGVLLKEKAMNEAKSKAHLERILKREIKHISTISAAMYVHPKICAPGSEHESGFYFRPLKGKDSLQELVSQECLRIKVGEGPLMLSKYMSYFRGEKEIPKQTHGTELRAIYNFFRENGHCFEGDRSYPTADKVLFTLFFDGVKKNFASFYGEELTRYKDQINSFKDNFDDHFDNYINEKQLLIDMIKERAPVAENTFADELQAISTEYQKIYMSLADKFVPGANPYNPEIANATPEEMKMFERMSALAAYNRHLYQMNYMSQMSSNSNELSVEALTQSAARYEEMLARKSEYKEALWSNVKTLEAPDQEFFETASRKEVLDKAHELGKFNQLEIFTQNVPSTQIVSYSINEHLVNLNCVPFEWHEYTEASRQVSPGCFAGGMAGGGGETDEDEESLDTY